MLAIHKKADDKLKQLANNEDPSPAAISTNATHLSYSGRE
jgi:hypothetical protein